MSDKSRLLWRCRRGIREMDIVLQDFLNESYDNLSASDQKLFRKLLDQADLDILNWLMGKAEPETDALKRIMAIIRESRNKV